MENKGRRNKKSFAVISLLLIVCILSFVGSAILYFKNRNMKAEIKRLEKNNADKNEEVELYKRDIENLEEANLELSKIDENIESLKKEYFSNIKTLEDKILDGSSNKKIAYLTFDDGPYYNTYKFLDILDKYGVNATFFTTSINGEYCFDNRSQNCLLLYKEYLKRGHTIANHTYTHGIWKGLYSSVESFITGVKGQEEVVKEYSGGYVTNIVRFPGGSATARGLKNGIIEELRKNNYGWVDWTAQDGDGGNLTSKEEAWYNFTSTINEKIEVVLFHDYNNITLSILPDAIEYLQNNGYILLPLFYESNMINK